MVKGKSKAQSASVSAKGQTSAAQNVSTSAAQNDSSSADQNLNTPASTEEVPDKRLEMLKRKRKPVRLKLRTVIDESKEWINAEEDKDLRKLDIHIHNGARVFAELQVIDEEILNALLDKEASEVQYSKEKEEVENLRDEWTALNYDFNHLKMEQTPDEALSTATVKKKGFKRPEMKIKVFNGEIKEWLGFWAQFKIIHEDIEIHDSEKFQQLHQSMAPGSSAEAVIKPFPQTAENYPKAVAALQERFGNSKVLTCFYVRELIRLIVANTHQRMKVADIYDQVNAQLEALKSLGISATQMECFLYPMVESCLPEDILIAFQRSAHGADIYEEEFSLLLSFLKKEVELEQRRELARGGLGVAVEEKLEEKEVKEGKGKKKTAPKKENGSTDVPTAAGLFSGQNLACIFCDGTHESHECFRAQKMTMDEKKQIAKEKEACPDCLLKGHGKRSCYVPMNCINCHKKHRPLMCPSASWNRKQSPPPAVVPEKETSSQAVGLTLTGAVLLQTLLVRAVGNGVTKVIRLLLDTGAQGSHLKSRTAEELNLIPVGEVTMRKVLFGGVSTEPRRHRKFEITLESLDGFSRKKLAAVEEADLCGSLPSIPNGPWLRELEEKKIFLSDYGSQNVDIEFLVGSDYWGELMTGQIVRLSGGLTAMETVFGWTVSGPLPMEESKTMTVISNVLLVGSQTVSDLWDLEVLGITDPMEVRSKKEREKQVLEHFSSTVTRGEDGRYSVSLPWMGERQRLPDNRWVAEKRLMSVTTKLRHAGMVGEYHRIFQEWEKEGFIKSVQDPTDGPSHFLPHRAVFKPSSKTTPVRPVFDASCKVGRSPSLNECLEKGPNLMERIPSLLMRFREKRVGVLSDIRKAYQMIEIHPEEDRRFLRFLWWSDVMCTQLKVFEHQRVVFGGNCSPFLLIAVLEHHLTQVKDEDREIAEKLLRGFYVDNYVGSVDSEEEYQSFKAKSIELMVDAKMDLRDWESNVDVPQESKEEMTSVLGLKWEKCEDVIGLAFIPEEEPSKITKRMVLSSLQKIFDPVGFASPALLQPKILLQELWEKKLGWDEEIGSELKVDYSKWVMELPYLLEMKIPRQMITAKEAAGIQLHVFGDASQAAYAGVIFLRNVEEDGNIAVHLVQSKARVAPLKKGTIPRLELMACLISARLRHSVVESLGLSEVEIFHWTDSTTALAWIRRNDEWGTYVGNRVKEILELTDVEQWRHVPGEHNPADLPSRGCSPAQLIESEWWEGPRWLQLHPSQWPVSSETVDEESVAVERKKSTISMMVKKMEPWFVPKFSSYLANVRVMGWIRRFTRNLRQKEESRVKTGDLSIQELKSAEMQLLRIIQLESFPDGEKGINGLKVVRGEDQLIHVESRLLNGKDTELFKRPILLPSDHLLVKMYVQGVHRIFGHIGTQCCLGKIRERFWILSGRRTVKKVIHGCVICRRHESKPLEVNPAPLPEKRITITQSFQVTGVDLAGPLYLKDGSKVWVVLFTCAVYRGVALDLIHSLSTDAFLDSLERFVLTYGRPHSIYSDNGTNFVGSQNLIRSLDWVRIEEKSGAKQIVWIFNPPTAAWWGGWWERLIRSMKDQLKRMLGRARLDEEKLRTCLCTVAAALNNRPLTTLTEDEEDLIPLTPAMFIRGPIVTEFPEGKMLTGKQLQKDYKYTAALKKQLEGRFRREYLSLLVQRGKERSTPRPKVGDVVLIGADNRKRIDWPMGKIMKLIQGKDKEVRTAMVKTAHGVLIRPLQRLYPLEVASDDEQFKGEKGPKIPGVKELKKENPNAVSMEAPVLKTRSGRIIKKPQ